MIRSTYIKRSTKPISKVSKRKDSVSRSKKDAWTAFSKYIRLRDSLKYNNSIDIGICYTCKKEYPNWKVGGLQAGHFIPGRRNAYLFDERGVHAQCNNCNGNLKGNWPHYEMYMRIDYGDEVVAELKALYTSHQALSRKAYEYRELEATYKAKYDDLLQAQLATLNPVAK